jgi:hypothetical protein
MLKHSIRELYLKLVQGLPRAAANLLLTGLNRPSSDEGQPFLQMRDGSDSYRIWSAFLRTWEWRSERISLTRS